ncbi:energy-coupling factor ABC transporter ATP-binding protein [[Eubacterium] cellulosolvens]
MLLRVDKIRFEYPGGPEVLSEATFSADKGEIVSIIGSNGSGKTTLLMVAAGLLDPSKGMVYVEDKPLRKQLPKIRSRIGLVFQEPDDQLFNPTVYEELAFALRQILDSVDKVDERVQKITEKFDLKRIIDKPPYKLSIGEKRIVTLASVIAYDPEILLLDEPTANLSSGPIKSIKEILQDAKKSGKVVVIASHDVEFVASVSDRIYVLDKGSTIGGINARTILSDDSMLTIADMNPPLVLQTLRELGLETQNTPLTIREISNYKKSYSKQVSKFV